MRRFWTTVSHPVAVCRQKWLQHITNQGDQLSHHRGSETSKEVLATKGLLGGRWTWGERKLWVEDWEELARLAGGEQGTVSLWDFQSYCTASYGVRGNVPATERSWTQPNCQAPSDSWMHTWMSIFCRSLPIAETRSTMHNPTECCGSHEPIIAYLVKTHRPDSYPFHIRLLCWKSS